jgi:hypothetical protein
MMIFAVIVMLMAFVPFVDSVPLDENGYYYTPCWVNGCWNANTGLPTCSLSFSPPKTDVNISYLVTSPIYSSPYSQYIDIENTYAGASVCSGLSPPNMVNCGSQRGFLNQSFKYNSCNRLNIAFYMKVEPSLTDSPYLAVRTKDNFTTAYSTTTNWQYVSYDLPDPISGSDFIEFRNEWISPLHYVGYIGGTYYVNMMNYYIDDVYVHCEDPYSADNWVFNGNLDLESDVGECELPPTPSSNPCDDLYLITDRGIVVLLESVLYFIINLLQCWSALWMFIFLISIGSIFVLIFKNLSRQ